MNWFVDSKKMKLPSANEALPGRAEAMPVHNKLTPLISRNLVERCISDLPSHRTATEYPIQAFPAKPQMVPADPSAYSL